MALLFSMAPHTAPLSLARSTARLAEGSSEGVLVPAGLLIREDSKSVENSSHHGLS